MPIERVFEFLDYQVAHYPQEKAFGSRANGQWNFYSINQIMDSAKRLAQGLMHAGYLRGDNIAIITYKINRNGSSPTLRFNMPVWYQCLYTLLSVPANMNTS